MTKRPTEQQYKENIKKIQNHNLESEVFKNAYPIAAAFMDRELRNTEYKFSKIYDKFKREIDKALNVDIDKNKAYKYYLEMISFINNLSDQELSSNIILSSFKTILDNSYRFAYRIVSEYLSQTKNCDDAFLYTIEVNVDKELSEVLLDWMTISISVPTPKDHMYPYEYINSIPDAYINYYYVYNKMSQIINLFAGDILTYQMKEILATLAPRILVQRPTFIADSEGIVKSAKIEFGNPRIKTIGKKRELK